MRVIRPVEMTPTKLVSTNAVEAHPTWVSSTTYSKDQRVVFQVSIYESLVSNNTNRVPNSSPTFWIRVGPSNAFAMFDNQVSTQTVRLTPLEVSIAPNTNVTSIALINLEAVSAKVQVFDAPGGNLVFEEDVNLDDTIITDWFEYFFEEYSLRNDAIVTGIPPYKNSLIRVSFNNGVSNVRVGAILFGTIFDIGCTQYGLNYGIRDYSVKDTDEFGTTTFLERNFSKRVEPNVFVCNTRVNDVSKVLTNLRATPTVWVTTEDTRFQGTIVYGFLKDWKIEIPYPTASLLRLEIEGLT